MSLKDYLISLLGRKKSAELEKAVRSGKLIVVSGVNGSGKTTLVKVLKEKGYNAIEDFEVYNLNLDKKLDDVESNILTKIIRGEDK